MGNKGISSVNLGVPGSDPVVARARNIPSHVTVCVPTFKRSHMLHALLRMIIDQYTGGLFTMSVVVVDNDPDLSAHGVVEGFLKNTGQELLYLPLPHPNIASARNLAVRASTGDYVAFIDDDEYPTERWLFSLVTTIQQYRVSAVLGPVLPHFDVPPPGWVKRGGLCDRPRYRTGTRLRWQKTRTGNVIFRMSVFKHWGYRFDPAYGILGGEDVAFFKRFLRDGSHRAVWCDEAVAFEHVPAHRMAARWFMRRAYIRGHVSFSYFRSEMTPYRRIAAVFKSLVALSVYIVLFPVLPILGFHVVMQYLTKMAQHFGHASAALGVASPEKRGK